MFERVLVPIPPEASDPSVGGLAVELADQFDADLLVLSVLDRPQQRDQIRSDLAETARETTDPIIDRAEERGVTTDRLVRDGDVVETVLGVTETEDVDVAVLATQARTGVDRLVLGSAAEDVIREAPVPVLTASPEASDGLPDLSET